MTPQRMIPSWALTLVLLLSAALKLVYVFGLTDYSQYVMSDSAHYFDRALAFYNGQSPTRADWDVYPMGATTLLALYWQVLATLGMDQHQLQSALVLNIAASTVTVALLWHLALRLTQKAGLALLIAGSYSLFYPLVYLNSFTLSESPAQLFFMLSVWTMIEAYHRTKALHWLALSGLCWAIACHCRGSFLPCAAASVLVACSHPPASLSRLKAGSAFLLPGLAVFALASSALWAATGGLAYKPTGNNGGFNFFMQQCHFHGARSIQPDWTWAFFPPVFRDLPQLGIYETTVSFLQQDFFYREGIRCIVNQPGSIMRLIAFGPEMIYGNFYPTFPSAKGFEGGMAWSRHISLVLLLLAPAGFFALLRQHRPAALLLLLHVACLYLTFIFFSADHRHLYSLAFIYFLLGISGFALLWQRPWLDRLHHAARATLVVAVAYWLFSGKGLLALKDPKPATIAHQLISAPVLDGTPWYSLDAVRFWAPITIDLGGVRHARKLHLALDHNDVYTLSFWRAGQRLGAVQLSLAKEPPPPKGLVGRNLVLPDHIAAAGYDQLQVQPVSGDGRYSLADLQLEPGAASPTRRSLAD